MELSGDKKSLALNIAATFSATEVERLIHQLMERRQDMLPPVPAEVPKVDGQPALYQARPKVSMNVLTNQHIRLWLHNHGLGWIAYDIDQTVASAMRDYLTAHTQPQLSDLFGEQLTNRH